MGDILVDIILGAVSAFIATEKALSNTPRRTLKGICFATIIASFILKYTSVFGVFPTFLLCIGLVIYGYLCFTSKEVKEIASEKDVNLDEI